MKMRRFFRSAAALLLAVAMTFLTPAQTVLAAGESEPSEEYLDGLFERCSAYLGLEGVSSYENLLNPDNYLHCIWAAEIRRMLGRESYGLEDGDEKSFLEKASEYVDTALHNMSADVKIVFTWAGHALTDTELNEESYIDYLSKIMAMQEKGFLETAWSQADYSIRVNAWTELKSVGKKSLSLALKDKQLPGSVTVKLNQVLGEDTVKELDKLFKKLKKTKKFVDFADKEVMSLAEAGALGIYVSLHEEQKAFLEAIRDYADQKNQKELRKAAEDLIDASSMRLAGLIMSDDGEIGDFAKMASYLTGGELDLDQCVDDMAEMVSRKTKELAASVGNTAGAYLLKGVSALASNAALISAGFEIGGHLGRVLFGMGDEYEHYREMIIMDDIGTALAAAFPKYAAPAGDKHVVGDSRYDTTFRMVAAGEALCYVRLKGEYSILEYEKGKQGAPDDKELDRLYASAADRMNLCYMALASIFPEPAPRVSVYADIEREKVPAGNNKVSRDLAIPTVYIEGNEEAAEKINGSDKLKELADSSMKVFENAKKGAERMTGPLWVNMEGGVHLWLEDAFSTKQAVSMRFKQVSYEIGSAHPNHVIVCTNYDTSTGAYLTLEDILDGENPEKAREKLQELLGKALEKAYPEWDLWYMGRVESTEEIVKTAFLDASAELKNRHWYFSSDGFHIAFDPYEIAPYTAGSITAAVPYSQLKGVIKEEYLPEELRGIEVSGTPKLIRWDELERGDKSKFTGGRVYGMQNESYKAVVTDETACNVRVQKDYNVVFYSSRMMPSDVAWMNDMEEIDSLGGEAEYTITSETNLIR